MKMFRKLALAACAVSAIATAALAIQPGTSGTWKERQQQAVRIGVLEQLNNTGTASSGAVTMNAGSSLNPMASGIVTSESLSTAQGSPYTLTITNTLIAAADIVVATVQNGTNTGGNPFIKTVTPAAGSVAIIVGNSTENTPGSFNGTLKISFFVIKQSAHNND